MEYVCDAPRDETWFRLMTEAEAVAESEELRHAVEKHYRRERERAADSLQRIRWRWRVSFWASRRSI